jgi:hypothetical protein
VVLAEGVLVEKHRVQGCFHLILEIFDRLALCLVKLHDFFVFQVQVKKDLRLILLQQVLVHPARLKHAKRVTQSVLEILIRGGRLLPAKFNLWVAVAISHEEAIYVLKTGINILELDLPDAR